MRLTVRTLLAYLDGMLDEESRKVLAAKLEESPYAGELAQRITDSVSSSDIGAPDALATHPIEDPNTIAEYLDNVLQGQHVPEVEKVLLESPMHMSETAACHQILTLVLSRPANVSPELRDKMYRLSQRLRPAAAPGSNPSSAAAPSSADRAPSQTAGVASPSNPATTDLAATSPAASGSVLDRPDLPGAALDGPLSSSGSTAAPSEPAKEARSQPASPRGPASAGGAASASTGGSASASSPARSSEPKASRPMVPEYLRSGRPSLALPLLIGLGLLAVLGFIVAKAFVAPMSRQLAQEATPVTPENPVLVTPQQVGPDNFGPAGEQPNLVVVAEPVEPEGEPEKRDAKPVTRDVTVAPIRTKDVGTADKPAPPDTAPPSSEPQDPLPVPATPAPPQAESIAQTPPQPNPATGVAVQPETSPEPTEMAEKVEPAEPAPVTPEAVPTEAAAAKVEGIGTYESIDSLAGITDDGSRWNRLKTGETVVSGMRIVGMPTFRSVITLKGKGSVTMVGSTELQFAMGEGDSATINVEAGRLLLSSNSAGLELSVAVDADIYTVELPTASTIAAVHVGRFRTPGDDPAAGAPTVPVIGIYAAKGDVGVSGAGADMLVPEGSRFTRIGSDPATSAPAVAQWAMPTDETRISIESTARKGLLEQITENETLEASLRSATRFRRSEVAALAGQSLLQLGISDVFFGEDGLLSNEAQKQHTRSHYLALVRQIDLGTESAERVLSALKQKNPVDIKEMYAALVGSTDDQLTAGADFDLVDGLSSSNMALRVLSVETLRYISGINKFYRPFEKSAARREPKVKQWGSVQQKGDIRWAEPPAALRILETYP